MSMEDDVPKKKTTATKMKTKWNGVRQPGRVIAREERGADHPCPPVRPTDPVCRRVLRLVGERLERVVDLGEVVGRQRLLHGLCLCTHAELQVGVMVVS